MKASKMSRTESSFSALQFSKAPKGNRNQGKAKLFKFRSISCDWFVFHAYLYTIDCFLRILLFYLHETPQIDDVSAGRGLCSKPTHFLSAQVAIPL